MMKLVGIDGCKFGWVAVALSDRSASLFKNLDDLVNFYDTESLFLIDMPIGLPDEHNERNCEILARKELSAKRKSSLFPIPCRKAVYAENYEEANKINRDILQKGISKQSWFICAKIKELDELLIQNPQLQSRIRESHPEVGFHYLNFKVSMKYNKKTDEGQQERLNLLSMFSINIRAIYRNTIQEFKRKDVAKDDIVDALCLAVILEEIIKNNVSMQSPNVDGENLAMKINVFDVLNFGQSVSSLL